MIPSKNHGYTRKKHNCWCKIGCHSHSGNQWEHGILWSTETTEQRLFSQLQNNTASLACSNLPVATTWLSCCFCRLFARIIQSIEWQGRISQPMTSGRRNSKRSLINPLFDCWLVKRGIRHLQRRPTILVLAHRIWDQCFGINKRSQQWLKQPLRSSRGSPPTLLGILVPVAWFGSAMYGGEVSNVWSGVQNSKSECFIAIPLPSPSHAIAIAKFFLCNSCAKATWRRYHSHIPYFCRTADRH